MAYSKQTWSSNELITADKLNHIEDGIPTKTSQLSNDSGFLTSHQSIAGKKNTQSAVSSPSASGTAVAFIDTISQDTQGVISPTKKSIPEATTNAAGLMSSSDKTKLIGAVPKSDLTSIIVTGTTNTTGEKIATGTYFYLNGTLVQALTNIASDANFTSGTNYETVTVGGLNIINNQILKVDSIQYIRGIHYLSLQSSDMNDILNAAWDYFTSTTHDRIIDVILSKSGKHHVTGYIYANGGYGYILIQTYGNSNMLFLRKNNGIAYYGAYQATT